MEENSKASVTLVDLVKLFRKKFKLLVVITLLAAVVGGVCGAFLAVRSETYYAEMEISVSPTDGSNELLYLLRSGRFAEQMLLEENGLPAKDLCNAADYDAALKALEELASIREERIEKYREVSRHYISDVEHQYKALTEEYNSVLTLLKMYKEAQADALVSATHEAKIAIYEAKLDEAELARKEYYDGHYAPAIEKKFKLDIELARLTDQMNDQKKEADAAVEKVLAAWRKDPSVANQIEALMSYVTYEFHVLEEETSKDATQKAAESGYITIKIAVPKSAVPASYAAGEDYVRDFVEGFETRMAVCIRDYLEEDLNAYEVDCTITNPLIHVSRGPNGIVSSAVKYGLIFAVIGVVLAYGFFALQLVVKVEEGIAAHSAAPSETEKK